MRVIAGKARGIKLTAPKGFDVRPAQDRVKESIFNILGSIADERVLDVFAGSGSLGIEALSRGAASAVFIEASKPCAKSISDNLIKCRLEDKARIMTIDFKRALKLIGKKDDSFEIIFAFHCWSRNRSSYVYPMLTCRNISWRWWSILFIHHWRFHRHVFLGRSLYGCSVSVLRSDEYRYFGGYYCANFI